MIKRALYQAPWGAFIFITSIFAGTGLIFVLSLGFYINDVFGVLGMAAGVLMNIIFIPFCLRLSEGIDNYFNNKIGQEDGE